MWKVYASIFLVLIFLLIVCRQRDGYYLDFLPTTGNVPTGEGGYLLEGSEPYVKNYSEFDLKTCWQCRRDYSDPRACSPYCVKDNYPY